MSVRRNVRFCRAIAVAAVVALLTVWVSYAVALCPRMKFVNPDDKSVEVGWTMGVDESTIPDFGGYRVWMREVWQDADLKLAAEYVWGEDDTSAAGYWPFRPFYEDSIRVYVNDRLQNAFPYVFSVTAFEAGVSVTDTTCLLNNASGIVYPRVGVSDKLSTIRVIPNPYRTSAAWEVGSERRVTFVGLPAKATIRIYSTSLNLVRTIRHDNPTSDQAFWDLMNSDGEDIAPGIYVWVVDVEGLGSTEGRMMIIK